MLGHFVSVRRCLDLAACSNQRITSPVARTPPHCVACLTPADDEAAAARLLSIAEATKRLIAHRLKACINSNSNRFVEATFHQDALGNTGLRHPAWDAKTGHAEVVTRPVPPRTAPFGGKNRSHAVVKQAMPNSM